MNRNVQIALVALVAVGLGTLVAWFFLGDGLESLVSPPSPTAQVAVGSAGMPATASAPAQPADKPAPHTLPDPEKALVRLEQSKDAGRATPAATVQTLVWAVTHGEDAALAACIALDPAAREKAAAFITRLPPNARNAYRTPEQIAGLLVARDVLQNAAYRIVGVAPTDGNGAIVILRVSDGQKEQQGSLTLRHTADGWVMPIIGWQMEDMLRQMGHFTPE